MAQKLRTNVFSTDKLWYNPEMIKISVIWLVSASVYLASGLFQTTQPDFSVITQLVSELPVLVATIWLFLKLASLHLITIEKLIETFGEREQRQREYHKNVIDRLLETIEKKHQDK